MFLTATITSVALVLLVFLGRVSKESGIARLNVSDKTFHCC